MQPNPESAEQASRRNRRVVAGCLSALFVMGAVTAASPLLYRLFCQATGYGGTTQRAEGNLQYVLDRTITVRFDSNVAPNLAWKFEPVVSTIDVKIGETALAFFRATNLSDKPLTGQAAFNVTPETFGAYFNKIECFCFKEQTLQPGQSVEMPVTFFIDAKMLEDRDTAPLSLVTLSYVFFPLAHAADATLPSAPPANTGG